MASHLSTGLKLTLVFLAVGVAGVAVAQTNPGSRPFQFSPAPPAEPGAIAPAQATQTVPATPSTTASPAVPGTSAPLLALPPAIAATPTATSTGQSTIPSAVPPTNPAINLPRPAPPALAPATSVPSPAAAPLAASPLAATPVQAAQAPLTSQPAAVISSPTSPPAAETASSVELVDMDSIKQALGPELYKAWEIVAKIWDMTLVRDSNKNPVVSVGTLISGIVLMGLGYIAAGMTSRWMATKLLTRFGLSKSGVAPLQSIAFYALLATFTMLSLNVLSVPLTVFSFLGGALAIGAGFGSQNIVNNFISGLILLAERPIRVGDVIQLDNWTGTVTQIGARSTKIATGSNHEIIVPNSKLLETTVANWTLSDDTVGCTISIGAAYGSPTREVQRLLLQAAQQHPQILRDPAPQVVFADFAADSLLFQLKFWVNLRQSSKGEVESDLRFAIDELFADRGLVIAYPQRDVHLNVLRPVEVRLTQPVSQLKAAA